MERKNSFLLVVVIAVVVFVSVYLTFSQNPVNYDDFAKCLTDKGITMYGTDWCSHCKDQKAMFGSSFEYVDYKNCDIHKADCNMAGIGGYPTWVINGKKYPGTHTLQELSSLSGCSLE